VSFCFTTLRDDHNPPLGSEACLELALVVWSNHVSCQQNLGSRNACDLYSHRVSQACLCIIYLKRCMKYLPWTGEILLNQLHLRCLVYWLFYIYGSIVIQIIVASVLIARIWAIYQMKIWALAALSLGCAALSIPSIVLLQMQASGAHLMENPAPNLISGCPTTINPLAFVPYLPPFIAETILFVLTIYKPLKISRQVSTPLMSQLIIHGTQYYTVVFITLAFIVVGSLFPRTNHVVNGSGFVPV
ncbi:unnamed protein product, partial [Rhizoctonia solani]